MRPKRLQHRFVEFIPDMLDEGILYVSMEYMTVAHKCCCGCGSEVSISLSPTDWHLIFDGKTISLEPSIGSRTLPCRSHYFITKNQVRWAHKFSDSAIYAGREQDAASNEEYYESKQKPTISKPVEQPQPKTNGFWSKLVKWWK